MSEFRINSQQALPIDSLADISLTFEADQPLRSGAKLWLFYDIRQDAGRLQNDDRRADNHLSVANGDGVACATMIHGSVSRTLDLYPDVPEFHVSAEIAVPDDPGKTVDIHIRRWQTPLRPIGKFHFWLVVDQDAAWEYVPTGHKVYRKFIDRHTEERVAPETVAQHLFKIAVEIQGEHRRIPAMNVRKTPGVFWGELHGMCFNQRPLDDFYHYAKGMTRLDFCAAIRFSYNTNTFSKIAWI